MSKIQEISITNFKAIDEFQADFNGCTAIITGGNNKGKTSLLRGIPDRIRFIRPDVIVKEGEKEGKGEMLLDTGEKFVWEYNIEGKDKLTYITNTGIKQSVTVEIGKKFFPVMFDIDKFLQSAPKKQSEQLQAIVGLDFSEIDERYRVAYDNRTERNREAERYHVKLTAMLKVDAVSPVDLTELQKRKEFEKNRLNKLYLENKGTNDKKRNAWNLEKQSINEECRSYNKIQSDRLEAIRFIESYRNRICNLLDEVSGLAELVDISKLIGHIKSLPINEPLKIAEDLYPKEPEYITEKPDSKTLDAIDNEIILASETNAKASEYQTYINQKESTEAAAIVAKEADQEVKNIEQERLKIIESANMPKGISITPDGITVDGLPLDKNQISLSKLYCSALRIASMGLGEVKTLYFDASSLDRNSLKDIEDWANENNLQLLIERPDFEAGEIKYTLIENI